MTTNQKLGCVAAGNAVFGIVTACLAPIQLADPFGLARVLPPYGLDRILVVPLIASIFCQGVLFALWATAFSSVPGRRFLGLAVGTIYLEALVPADLTHEMRGLGAITVAVVAAALLAARWRGWRLVPQAGPDSSAPSNIRELRFSIRGLMLLVAVTAVLSDTARGLRTVSHGSPGDLLVLSTVWALCFIVIGLTALWTALGNGGLFGRGALLFGLAPTLGAFFAFAVNAHSSGWVYIILSMSLYPMLLLASLLVVRSCGYRFAWRAHGEDAAPPVESGAECPIDGPRVVGPAGV